MLRDVMRCLMPHDKRQLIGVFGHRDQADREDDERLAPAADRLERVDAGARVPLDEDLEITVQARCLCPANGFGNGFHSVDHLSEICHRHPRLLLQLGIRGRHRDALRRLGRNTGGQDPDKQDRENGTKGRAQAEHVRMLTGFVGRSSPFTGLWSQAIVGPIGLLIYPAMMLTKVLYNDRCPICRAEIRHYRQRADRAGAPLVFEDLNATDLGAWQLTADQAKRRMHARLPDGQIVSGIPAFAAIWRALPGTGWLAWLVERPLLRGIADVLYNRVAAPLLYHKQLRREVRGLAAGKRQP